MGNTDELDVAYRNARGRVAELAATLDEEQLQLPVPATPSWSVRELLAHLVGAASDAAIGRLDGIGSHDWTARHIAERHRYSVGELIAEWSQAAPMVESGLVGLQFRGPNAAADLICHEADLQEALSLGRIDRNHWEQPFLEVMMLLLGLQLQNIATVTVTDEQGRQWVCGSGTHNRLRADGYELLRAMFSRRARRQIAAWEWAATPTPQMIDCFGFFGPRDDDQPIPIP
ncbi:maleylpyruvate isomerase N-terminal domain-containing protein [Mycobacteroides abscessus]|uniref:maleylpyruvate isomerase N-terminal domain-containing protein n=1 Tax=Mycobacteroides abscessus TaxID=36809 RepID=UPI000C256AC1|nr:maleylpyruvate isomerase N-terminal domain-containing protein [Mycobacteroides abscessus]